MIEGIKLFMVAVVGVFMLFLLTKVIGYAMTKSLESNAAWSIVEHSQNYSDKQRRSKHD